MRIVLSLLIPLALGSCLRVPDDLAEPDGGNKAAPATAAEVLARHVRAIGGEEKLRELTNRTVEARMVFRADKDCQEGDETCFTEDQTGSFVLQTTSKGGLYRRTVLGELVEERGFDGQRGWQLAGDVLRVDTPEEAVLSREDAVLHWYLDLDERKVQTTLVAPRKEDSLGKVAVLDGVRWQIGDSTPKTMWFDRSTGLLREEVVEEGSGNSKRRQVIVYDDYKKVDDVMVAWHIRVVNSITTGGERPRTSEQVVEFFTQRVAHDTVDTKKFAQPAVPKPKPVPDELLAQLQAARDAAAKAPRDATVQIAHARLAFAAGHFDDAERIAKATLAIESREPEALMISAQVQLMRGDFDVAARTLAKAARTGVKPEAIARQFAWIHARRRDFAKLADSLDAAGSAVLAGAYRSFVGKPLEPKAKPGVCVFTAPMVLSQPLAVVELDFGGKKVGAIVDTGASDVILSEKSATALGVTVRARSRLGEDGPELGHGEATAMKVGDLPLANVPVTVFGNETIDEMAGDQADKIGAVLGTAALSGFLVTIDVPGKKLELAASGSKCKQAREQRMVGDAVPFWVHETHYLYVMGALDDAEGLFLINTGMRGTDMAATQAAYAHAGIGAPEMRSDQTPLVRIEQLSLGPAAFPKVDAAYGFFEQSTSSDGFRIDGMIGLGVLGKRRFTIDYGEQKIWFARSVSP